ncbi:MAG: transglycosylase family protein [Candidatus Saccharibacteria bacterium]
MRIYTEVLATAAILISQVATSLVQIPATAQLTPRAEAAGTTTHIVTLNISNDIKSYKPLAVVSTKPSFDDAVVKPLKAKQEAAAQAEAAAKAKLKARVQTVRATVAPVIIGGADAFAKLRFCEAGGDYTKNTGNGYYGAYQYSLSTWGNYGGYARPDLAPPAVQDAKAQATQAARGWSPWPSCARKLGLM